MGQGRADSVLVNAVFPILLLHAEQTDDTPLAARVLDLYSRISAASDTVTRRFERHGTKPTNALEAQGLHQLYRTRCTMGRCLSCPVGQHVIAGRRQPEIRVA